MNSPLRVAVITNIIPAYRADYFRRIFADSELDVTVFCQRAIPGMNLPSIHQTFGERVVEVRYTGAARERIGWQHLPWRYLWRHFDVYFVHGNPRVLSNVLVSVLLRLAGKRVVIEGQLHTAGSNPYFEKLRLLWWRLFRYVYLYNDREAERLRRMAGFGGATAIGMNNGLDQSAIDRACADWPAARLTQWQQDEGLSGRTLVLSCARLESKNRFERLLDCIPALKARHPNLLWCVIGDGPQAAELQARTTAAGLRDNVRWLGAIYEENRLAPWFLSAQALVHPGAIGLSLLHAFGYGLPVVTHDAGGQHMPEFAALTNGTNGRVYPREDTDAMTSAILAAIDESPQLGAQAKTLAQTRFNTCIMAARFKAMCLAAAGLGGRP